MRTRWVTRALLGLTATVVATIGWAAPASAHVTVNPNSATQGGFAKVAFRVPNEKDTAGTVKVEIVLPKDAPVPSVSVKPLPGWTATTERAKLDKPIDLHGTQITEAVSKLTWTAAAGTSIQPGQFQEFEVSLGPLPAVDQMIFKALQTYSDGDIVRWIDEPVADGGDLEHPAPVLKLAKGADDHDEQPAEVASVAAVGPADDGGTPLALGLAALGVALAGLVLGLLAYRRSGSALGAASGSADH